MSVAYRASRRACPRGLTPFLLARAGCAARQVKRIRDLIPVRRRERVRQRAQERQVGEVRAAVAVLIDHLAEVEYELARRMAHGLAGGVVDRLPRKFVFDLGE